MATSTKMDLDLAVCYKSRMAKERWRVVPSEPHFEVSDRGRARSLDYTIISKWKGITPYTRKHQGRMLNPIRQSTGYLDITVDSSQFVNGKRVPRHRSLASMILEAFIGPPTDEKYLATHKDDNPRNNKLKNLAWGSQTDNMQDKIRNGNTYKPKGELHHNAKLTESQVRKIRKAYKRYGKEHIKLAKKFGITGGMARQIGKRKRWTHVP